MCERPATEEQRRESSANGARLRLHHVNAESGGCPREDQSTSRSWQGDSIVLCTLIEQMARERDDWKPAAAIQAVDALIVQLFARSQAAADAADSASWDRLVLLATLLGYRDLLSALYGNSAPLSRSLARCDSGSHDT